jgi:pyruvate formate-lyase/glycerol dehydratase family glycyl radical enzyme
LWNKKLGERDKAQISLERARLLTDSWKTTDGLPVPIRRGKAFEKIVSEIPIYIDEDQLLVGDFAAKSGFAEWYPEFSAGWVLKDVSSEKALQVFKVKDVNKSEMVEIARYWNERCVESAFFKYVNPEKLPEWIDMSEENCYIQRHLSLLDRLGGYHSVNYEKVITKGFFGILKEIEHEIKLTAIRDDVSLNKVNFLKGCAIAMNAGVKYGRRYAELAKELATKAKGKRKEELLKIAEVCEWVPGNPARNFYEALQSMWFVHVLEYLETRAEGESPGRIDQYLYPSYKRDIEKSLLDRERVIELLECLRVKMSTLRQFSNKYFYEGTSGEAQFHNITLGGQNRDGSDATNELSYLILEAAMRTKTPHPTLSIRMHDKLPDEFALKGIELVTTGVGYPAFFNDSSCIPYLLNLGVPLEDARNYVLGGCVVPNIAGQVGPGQPISFHLAKCLELALYDGFDPRSNKQVGPHTGKFENFKTFEEVVGAFQKQTEHFSIEAATIMNIQRCLREQMICPVFNDSLTDDCIKRGKSSLGDGARYQIHYHNGRTMINVADSLAAIKKCVFDDGAVSKKELLEALQCNFKGKEAVRKQLLAAPKYGNDDDYVDTLCNDLYNWWQDMVVKLDAGYGAKYLAAAYSVGGHTTAGERTGALPSGRLAGVSLAEGSLSPAQGSDTNGPTAVINSCSKVDQSKILATLLNMKFHPSALKTVDDRKKLLALIKTYFDSGGKHVQFNVVDKKTLLEAKSHPELHRNLIVRVAGYSAFFTELSPTMQDEIIARTEHTLG